MPVERIIKLFAEHGFEMNKATAHGLIKKAAGLFDLVEDVLKETVLSDNYLSMDVSYYTVLTSDTNNSSGKSTAKGYIWAGCPVRGNAVFILVKAIDDSYDFFSILFPVIFRNLRLQCWKQDRRMASG